tara:strand:- start:15136 stop:15852 length:717 start_codon:yes stop_codon:yes gene_type:complete
VSADISITSLFLNATLFVKLIMFVLLSMSIMSWAIIFKKILIFREIKNRDHKFRSKFWNARDIFDFYKSIKAKKETVGSELVFKEGFAEFIKLRKVTNAPSNVILSSVKQHLQGTVHKIALKLEENVSSLATIASVSPYIGLLGTVWGIMHSFISIGSVQQATLAMVAPGIAEALIATAMGLLVAIPASVAYNRFSSQINYSVNQMELFSDRLFGVLQHEVYSKNVASNNNQTTEQVV